MALVLNNPLNKNSIVTWSYNYLLKIISYLKLYNYKEIIK